MKEHKEYSEDGVLLKEGRYNLKSLKTGLWKEYYENGKIAAEESFLDGKLHGYFRSYHENGNIWCIGNYNQNNKEGKFEIYDQQGKLIFIQHYNHGKLVKKAIRNT
ncbi:MAG: hypothetical protein NT175_02885 [Bacteroidetes bacterium]|nr:hypothetical protein [Bacteroidota bacterium]